MMSAENHLRMIVGDQVIQISVLRAQVEDLQAQIAAKDAELATFKPAPEVPAPS